MSYLFHLCTWNSETNKCLCLSTSDTTVPKGWRKNMGGPHSSRIMHRTLVLCDGAARIITKHTYKCKTCVWALWWISFPSMCFSNAPNQLPNHNIHRDIKTWICYACILCAPEKAPKFGTFSTLATALTPPSSSSSLCLFSPSASSLEKLDAFFFFLCVSSASFF